MLEILSPRTHRMDSDVWSYVYSFWVFVKLDVGKI